VGSATPESVSAARPARSRDEPGVRSSRDHGWSVGLRRGPSERGMDPAGETRGQRAMVIIRASMPAVRGPRAEASARNGPATAVGESPSASAGRRRGRVARSPTNSPVFPS
jgi:hypothetical protein